MEGIDDILAELPAGMRTSALQHRSSPTNSSTASAPTDLRPEEAQILALVQPEETHIEALIHNSQLPAHVVASILVTLELRGVVRQLPGKFFVRL